MADVVAVDEQWQMRSMSLRRNGSPPGEVEPDHFVHRGRDLFHLLDLQRLALVEALPIKAGPALGVAVVGDEQDQVDGLFACGAKVVSRIVCRRPA